MGGHNLWLVSRADRAAADAQVTGLEWEKKVSELARSVGWLLGAFGVASAGCCV